MVVTIRQHEPAPVPHLTTALSGPLRRIEQKLLDDQVSIEAWFRHQWQQTPAPFYASVDLRNAGFKIAPVDTNLFPAGFNNLNPVFRPLCVQAVQSAVERLGGGIDRVLVVPENHTRNLYYLEHLAVLRQLLEQAGFEVRLGSLLPAAEIPTQVVAAGGRPLQLVALERHGDRLRAGDFEPQLVLLNNDLSAGCPPLLQGLAQPVVPAARMGWSERSKTVYFEHYRRVVEEFTAHIGLEDAWLLQASFYDCREIDFMKREGEACVQARVALLLEELHDKYRAYGIGERPFVVIKADAGTYGMAVMTVRSPQEVVALNRRQRTRMATSKEGRKVERVLIQEGVHTGETWGEPGHAAEPVVYMVDHNVVGGFYRVHAERGTEENLNAPGMQFEPLAFADCCSSPDQELSPEAHCNRFYSYGVVARLAVLAAAREAHA